MTATEDDAERKDRKKKKTKKSTSKSSIDNETGIHQEKKKHKLKEKDNRNSDPDGLESGNKEEKRRRGRSKDSRLLDGNSQDDPQKEKKKEKKRSKSKDVPLIDQDDIGDLAPFTSNSGTKEEKRRRGLSKDTRLLSDQNQHNSHQETTPTKEKKRSKSKDPLSLVETESMEGRDKVERKRRGHSKDGRFESDKNHSDTTGDRKHIKEIKRSKSKEPSSLLQMEGGDKEEKNGLGHSKDRLHPDKPQHSKPNDTNEATKQRKEKKPSKSKDKSFTEETGNTNLDPPDKGDKKGRGRSKDARLRPGKNQDDSQKTIKQKKEKLESKDASLLEEKYSDTLAPFTSNSENKEEKRSRGRSKGLRLRSGMNQDDTQEEPKQTKEMKGSKSKDPSLLEGAKKHQVKSKSMDNEVQRDDSTMRKSRPTDLMSSAIHDQHGATSSSKQAKLSPNSKDEKSSKEDKSSKSKDRSKSKERNKPKRTIEDDGDNDGKTDSSMNIPGLQSIPSSEKPLPPPEYRRGRKDEILQSSTTEERSPKLTVKAEQNHKLERMSSARSWGSSDSSAVASFADDDDKDKVSTDKLPEPRGRRAPNGLFLSKQRSKNKGRILTDKVSEDDIFAVLEEEIDAMEQEKEKKREEEKKLALRKKKAVQKWKADADDESIGDQLLSTQSEHISGRPTGFQPWRPGQQVKAMDASELREMLKLRAPPTKDEAWKDSRWFRDEVDEAKPKVRLHGLSAFPVLTARPTSGGKIVTKASGAAYRLKPEELVAMTSKSKGRRSEINQALSAFLNDDSFKDLNYTIH